jgi:hypothetical protein
MTTATNSTAEEAEYMGLKNRKTATTKGDIEGANLLEKDDGKNKESGTYYWSLGLMSVVLVGALLVALAGGDIRSAADTSTTSTITSPITKHSTPKSTADVNFGNLKVETNDKNVKLALQMDSLSGKDSSLGPHKVQLLIDPSCKDDPRRVISMKVTGDALVSIPLQPSTSDDVWTGSFVFPVEGKYELQLLWNGCEGTADSPFTSLLVESLSLGAVPSAQSSSPDVLAMVKSKTPLPIFPPGFWLSKKHPVFAPHQETIKSNYLWMTQEKVAIKSVSTLYQGQSSLGASTVVQEGSPNMNPNSFRGLSNYEVVCWIGNQNPAAIARESFLSIRAQVASSQRPFKFHYNLLTDLSNPETSMTEKRTNRKCKQSWVMLDDTDNPAMEISQGDYRKQVIAFLKSLAGCMHDETWSVWMFTVQTNSTKMCHSPTLPRTHHHPCNDVLFDIFDDQKFNDTGLPVNVRLVDNTDITNAAVNAADVSATIAMRVFTLIGKQVDTWRAAGQIGKVDGLHRGSLLENDPADDCHF